MASPVTQILGGVASSLVGQQSTTSAQNTTGTSQAATGTKPATDNLTKTAKQETATLRNSGPQKNIQPTARVESTFAKKGREPKGTESLPGEREETSREAPQSHGKLDTVA